MSENLTKRELEIIENVAQGYCSKEIASYLFISVRTVETHRKNIKQKLGYNNFYSVLTYAFKHELIEF